MIYECNHESNTILCQGRARVDVVLEGRLYYYCDLHAYFVRMSDAPILHIFAAFEHN